MSRTLMATGTTTVRHSKQVRKRGKVPQGGKAPLSANELKQHARLLKDGRPMSGRSGPYVYYMRKGKQRWRRNVRNRDPRTFAQLRSRAVFGAASRTWSQGGPLTQEQRKTWRAEGAQTRSRPRLGQSGKLTGQMRFVGRNSTKDQRNRGLLLDPGQPGHREPQVIQRQALTAASPLGRPTKQRHRRKAKRNSLTAQVA